MQQLESSDVRDKISKSIRSRVVSDGARHLVRELLKRAAKSSPIVNTRLQVRSVRDSDCRDLWLWRNAPQMREVCFHSQMIPYASHKRWFKAKKKDSSVKLWIAEDKAGEKIGQVRFDARGAKAGVSVCLNPRYYGQGLGPQLIAAGSKNFFASHPGIQTIEAEVEETNRSSIKAFQKAGYDFVKTATKQGKKIHIYQRVRTA